MFTRFNTRIAAAALVGLGLLYAVIALASDHSAVSRPPPDLRADGAAVDVWKALALMADHPGQVALVDVRDAASQRLFRPAGAASAPGADANQLRRRAAGKHALIVVASKDAAASRLVGELRRGASSTRFHFLKGGARAWFLALELPVPLFNDQPPPFGYEQALARVRAWLREPGRGDAAAVRRAVERLATASYGPSLLRSKRKPKSSGKRKVITGGCG